MGGNRGIKVGGIFAAVVLGMTVLGASASAVITVGACCLPDGSCDDDNLDETACSVQGGDYQGDSTLCADVDCPCGSSPECGGDCPMGRECVPSMIAKATGGGALVSNQCVCRVVEGACCWPSGVCTKQSEESCVVGGATYQGDNTECADIECPRECGGSDPACDGDCPGDEVCVPNMMNGATGGGAQSVDQCKCVAPDGSNCDAPADCASENCVRGVCCNTPCDQPGEICNLAGDKGTCVQPIAAAPAVSNLGLLLATAVLLALGLVAILSLRRGRRCPQPGP